MDERKIGTLIEITYQASGCQTGLVDVKMEIYDEARVHDDMGDFPDVTMTEIGATGRYYGSFSPDAEGDWRVMIDSSAKKGKMVRDFKIVGHDVDSMGDAIVVVNADMAKNATVSKEATAAKDATVAKEASVADLDSDVAAVGGTVISVDGKANDIKAKTDTIPANPASAGNDGDTLKTLSDQLDGLGTPDSAPMIG